MFYCRFLLISRLCAKKNVSTHFLFVVLTGIFLSTCLLDAPSPPPPPLRFWYGCPPPVMFCDRMLAKFGLAQPLPGSDQIPPDRWVGGRAGGWNVLRSEK